MITVFTLAGASVFAGAFVELFPSADAVYALLVGGALSASIVTMVGHGESRRRKADAAPSLERRIGQAHAQLRESAGLISEISAELETRQAALATLQAEHEQYERLAALNREQTEAVARLVESTVERGHQRAARAAWWWQALFFALGLALGPVVQWGAAALLTSLGLGG